MKRLKDKPEARVIAKRIKLPCGPLSFSQISTYMLCQRSYYFQYIRRTPRVGWAENLTLGSAGHKGLETLLLQKKNDKPIDLSQASRAMYTGLQHDMKIAKVSKGEVQYINRQFKCIEKLVSMFADDFLYSITPTGVEVSIWVTLGGVPVVLKIDLVDNNKRVIDFKFTRKHKSDYDAIKALQLTMYAAGMDMSETGFISFKFPDLTKKTAWKPSIKEVRATKNTGDLSWCEDVVASFAKAIIRDSQANCEEAFMVCDPGHWKCSPKMCDWWSMCRGKEDRTIASDFLSTVDKPSWIGPLFDDWNKLGNPDKLESKAPGWAKKLFTNWNRL